MQPKINWIDNLRGIVRLMVVMIHTANVVHHQRPQRQSPLNWDIANVLKLASRVSVPLFFMISGYLGERCAQRGVFFTYRPVPYLLQRCRPLTFHFFLLRSTCSSC